MKDLTTYARYMEAREADAKALANLASAKQALYQCRQAAKRVPPQLRDNWAGTIKAAEDRLAQAKRRAAEAEATLVRAWGFHQASQADVKARRVTAKAAHKEFRAAKKAA